MCKMTGMGISGLDLTRSHRAASRSAPSPPSSSSRGARGGRRAARLIRWAGFGVLRRWWLYIRDIIQRRYFNQTVGVRSTQTRTPSKPVQLARPHNPERARQTLLRTLVPAPSLIDALARSPYAFHSPRCTLLLVSRVMSFLVPSQRGVPQQTLPDIPPVHNQTARSHLPLSSLPGYPHQDMPSSSAPSMPASFTPDPVAHSLPKIGETRCCMSFNFLRHLYIRLLAPPPGRTSDHLLCPTFHSLGRLCTNPPLPSRLVLVIVGPPVHLPRPCPRKPSRGSGRAPRRKVPPQLCPPRGTRLRKDRPLRCSRTKNNAWHRHKVRLCPL